MAQKFANAARAYLAASVTDTDTAITTTGGGSLFPVAGGADWFKAVLQDETGIEIVKCTAHTSGATGYTIVRGQDGTTARAFAAGSVFGLRITAADIEAALAALTEAALIDTARSFNKAQRSPPVALTDAATITPDFSYNNFTLTIGGNRTLANPTGLVAGQSGIITITQDATGSRTLAYGSYWDCAGGIVPALSTTAGAVDNLVYYVNSATSITFDLKKDVK